MYIIVIWARTAGNAKILKTVHRDFSSIIYNQLYRNYIYIFVSKAETALIKVLSKIQQSKFCLCMCQKIYFSGPMTWVQNYDSMIIRATCVRCALIYFRSDHTITFTIQPENNFETLDDIFVNFIGFKARASVT